MSTMDNEHEVPKLGGHAYSPVEGRSSRYTLAIEIEVDSAAASIVRVDFNPARMLDVGKAKLLAAALITMAQDFQAAPLLGDSIGGQPAIHIANMNWNAAQVRARREAAIAITEIETGLMFLVKALTAHA